MNRPAFQSTTWPVYGVEIWFIEAKAGPKEPLNDNEEKMRQTIEGAGGYYHVVRSVDDVERLLRR